MADPRPGPPLRAPVYAVGELNGATPTGDLDLVAQGGLTMGGRTRPDGTVAYTDLDHTYADDFPGATLTPENPPVSTCSPGRSMTPASPGSTGT
ncbi:hypothetical protein [Streptomyces sp. NPDC047718]|uniref:hypothetical protein n=1 Tax=Streptomyces sp. NPDC047718 TaxID=3155479 RepID=UPI0033F36FD8